MADGYIMIHRRIFDDWEYSKDPLIGWLFVYLIAEAGWHDKDSTLRRGQLSTSYDEITEAIGMCKNAARRCLDALVKSKNISVTKTRGRGGGLLITVHNYSKWQGKVEDIKEPEAEEAEPLPIINSRQAQDVSGWLAHLVEVNHYGQYVEAQWLEITAMKNGFRSLDELIAELNRRDAGSFYAHCVAQGKEIKTLQDTKAHFNNVYPILKNGTNSKNIAGCSGQPTTAADRRRAEYQTVGQQLAQYYSQILGEGPQELISPHS